MTVCQQRARRRACIDRRERSIARCNSSGPHPIRCVRSCSLAGWRARCRRAIGLLRAKMRTASPLTTFDDVQPRFVTTVPSERRPRRHRLSTLSSTITVARRRRALVRRAAQYRAIWVRARRRATRHYRACRGLRTCRLTSGFLPVLNRHVDLSSPRRCRFRPLGR